MFLAFAAVFVIVGTAPSSCANSERGANIVAPTETPAIARRLRRDIPLDCFMVNLLSSPAVGPTVPQYELISKRAGMNRTALVNFLKSTLQRCCPEDGAHLMGAAL